MSLSRLSKRMLALFMSLMFLCVIPPAFRGNDPQPLYYDGIDQDDGIYYSDTFDTCNLYDCDITTGKVILDYIESDNQNYDFYDWIKNPKHSCYYFDSPIFLHTFFSIDSYMTLFNEKNLPRDSYKQIGKVDYEYYPRDLVYSVSKSIYRVHHFRFKLTQNDGTTSFIDNSGEWYGKFENESDISVYQWYQATSLFGYWKKLPQSLEQYPKFSPKENKITFTLLSNLTKFNNGFIDICVVLTPRFAQKCRLFTDYVKISVRGEQYADQGYIQSPLVAPETIYSWEYAKWEDYTPANTNISYQFYYENNNGELQLIEDTILPNNSKGFYKEQLIDLYSVPIRFKLSIRAKLSTNDFSISPELYNWGFSWQNTENAWVDQFASPLRISINDSTNINIETGKISLLSSIYNWPMFGHNPKNTRNTSSIGPGEGEDNSLWYALGVAGEKLQNPIISNGALYIASKNGTKLLKFSNVIHDYSGTELSFKVTEELPLGLKIKTSPAVTDNIVVVATAASKPGGIDNIVFGFNSNTLSEQWKFEYGKLIPTPSNSTICYESSPVVYNGRIYLTTWSGDSSRIGTILDTIGLSQGNNKVICLNGNTGTNCWISSLPAGSFSSPAVTDELVIAGCDNLFGPSLFAFSAIDGKEQWNRTIGLLGYASPVIYNGNVYAISKTLSENLLTMQTRLVALDIGTGKILWNITLWNTLVSNEIYAPAYNSITIANNIIYVVSPKGDLYAFDSLTQKELWNENIYKGKFSFVDLTSSPAYANGFIYVGAPNGYLYAIKASNGDILFSHPTEEFRAIFSSPIVVDGIVFITTENGMLEAIGTVHSAENQQTTGRVLSEPIKLPESNDTKFLWKTFSAKITIKQRGAIKFSILDESKNIILPIVTSGSSINSLNTKNIETIRLQATFYGYPNEDVILNQWSITFDDQPLPDTKFYDDTFAANPPICSIKVRNEKIGLWNTTAKFRLQYYKSSGLQITAWLPANFTGINGSKAKETISVNFSTYSSINNITRYDSITFSIKDMNGTESFSKSYQFEDIDTEKPVFYLSSFEPNSRNITSPIPICTIKARDVGVSNNISGINVSSATFTIGYTDQVGTKTYTGKAQCTGTNGIKTNVTLTANIPLLDFSENITDTSRIKFAIKDMANPPNENSTSWITLNLDNVKPTSTITNANEIPKRCNTSPVVIKANASDAESGVKEVTLQYKLTSSTQWLLFGSDSIAPYTWSFTISGIAGGVYDLCSVAIDKAGNEEDRPATPDLSFIFDPNDPPLPIFSELYEFSSNEIPSFSDVTFKDDYQLKQVSYRMDFERIDEWTPLNTEDIQKPTYTPTWNITKSQWNAMIEDQVHYIYFKITDMLNNTVETPSNKALKIIKNLKNISIYDPNISDFKKWSWNNEYKIKIDLNDTQIEMMQLWYNYSNNETPGVNFVQYGKNLTNESSWTFIPDHGTGYYSFKIKIIDSQGTEHLSNVKTAYITVFPLMELMIFVILFVTLLIVSILIIRKFKKVTVLVQD